MPIYAVVEKDEREVGLMFDQGMKNMFLNTINYLIELW